MKKRKLQKAKQEICARCSPDNKTVLNQSDFNSGTYRIKSSGYYILGENIEFQPIPADEATRTDQPGIGWFAIITVETDYVVLDLNGHTIEATQEFLNQHIFNLFSIVELDNSQFPGPQYRTNSDPLPPPSPVTPNTLLPNTSCEKRNLWSIGTFWDPRHR